jgi:putative membrane protein
MTNDLKGMVNAGQIQASLPAGVDADQQQRLAELQKLSGAPFEDAYNKEQVQNHENMVVLLQYYARNGDNLDLKVWAANVLPKVKDHLVDAQRLKRSSI